MIPRLQPYYITFPMKRCLSSYPGSDVMTDVSTLDARVKVLRAGRLWSLQNGHT